MGKDIITEGVDQKEVALYFFIWEDSVTSKHIFAKIFSKSFCISIIFTNFIPIVTNKDNDTLPKTHSCVGRFVNLQNLTL